MNAKDGLSKYQRWAGEPIYGLLFLLHFLLSMRAADEPGKRVKVSSIATHRIGNTVLNAV
jgi:hypothetical protein